MRLLVVLLACVALLAAGCGGGDEAATPTQEGTTGETDTTTEGSGPVVRIETEGGDVVVAVEVADSNEERQVGLMNRESLPEDAGMLFVFQEDSSGGFWMKNTLIPLSIAFADANGRILRILDMEPCKADPCEIYDPGVFYRLALEVNQGAFERWSVEEGDRLRLER